MSSASSIAPSIYNVVCNSHQRKTGRQAIRPQRWVLMSTRRCPLRAHGSLPSASSARQLTAGGAAGWGFTATPRHRLRYRRVSGAARQQHGKVIVFEADQPPGKHHHVIESGRSEKEAGGTSRSVKPRSLFLPVFAADVFQLTIFTA